MRPPGPLEIGLIIVVMLLTVVVMRIVRVGRNAAEKSKKSSVEIPERQVKQSTGKSRLKFVGIAFILTGILLLLTGINLFKWVYWSYLWSFIIVVIGFIIVFMSRRR